jgi:hypothetical protein
MSNSHVAEQRGEAAPSQARPPLRRIPRHAGGDKRVGDRRSVGPRKDNGVVPSMVSQTEREDDAMASLGSRTDLHALRIDDDEDKCSP